MWLLCLIKYLIVQSILDNEYLKLQVRGTPGTVYDSDHVLRRHHRRFRRRAHPSLVLLPFSKTIRWLETACSAHCDMEQCGQSSEQRLMSPLILTRYQHIQSSSLLDRRIQQLSKVYKGWNFSRIPLWTLKTPNSFPLCFLKESIPFQE